MKMRTRLAAGTIAAVIGTGIGLAAAAPASADERIVKSGFGSLAFCQIAESSTTFALIASGKEIHAGDSCGYWGPQRKYGFSIIYS